MSLDQQTALAVAQSLRDITVGGRLRASEQATIQYAADAIVIMANALSPPGRGAAPTALSIILAQHRGANGQL